QWDLSGAAFPTLNTSGLSAKEFPWRRNSPAWHTLYPHATCGPAPRHGYRPEPSSSALHACRVHHGGHLIRTRTSFGGGAQGFGGRPEGGRAKQPGGFRKTKPSQNTGHFRSCTCDCPINLLRASAAQFSEVIGGETRIRPGECADGASISSQNQV